MLQSPNSGAVGRNCRPGINKAWGHGRRGDEPSGAVSIEAGQLRVDPPVSTFLEDAADYASSAVRSARRPSYMIARSRRVCLSSARDWQIA
jgi:hypothetical protein